MARFFSLPLFLVLVFAFEISSGRPIHAEIGKGAQGFIQELADEAVTSLTGEGISTIERRNRFRALMLEKFAFKVIAKWVLGRQWRKASQSERTEYLRLFEDLMVVTYADRFAKYSGEKLTIKEAEVRGERDVLVHSLLTRAKGAQPIKVAWRVRKTEIGHKIVDVMVEGVSMGLAQKKEFASVIRKNGGKLTSLLDELRKRLNKNI